MLMLVWIFAAVGYWCERKTWWVSDKPKLSWLSSIVYGCRYTQQDIYRSDCYDIEKCSLQLPLTHLALITIKRVAISTQYTLAIHIQIDAMNGFAFSINGHSITSFCKVNRTSMVIRMNVIITLSLLWYYSIVVC